MKVYKFGGSILKNVDDINNILNIINSCTDNVICIVSAFQGCTNWLLKLISIAEERAYTVELNKFIAFHKNLMFELGLNTEPIEYLLMKLNKDLDFVHQNGNNDEITDSIISTGERLSSLILYSYFKDKIDAGYLSLEKYIKTDSSFGHAHIDFNKTNSNISGAVALLKNRIIIAPGFIASNEENKITTIGRNGSDYTASIVASAVKATEITIWKDTDGLYTADPKIVKDAKFIKQISYQEMTELASMGNQVLHVSTIMPAITSNIPIVLRNAYNKKSNGTLVNSSKTSNYLINGVMKMDGLCVISLIANEFVSINDFISQTQQVLNEYIDDVMTISFNFKQRIISTIIKFSTQDTVIEKIKSIFPEEFKEGQIKLHKGTSRTMISVIGAKFDDEVGISGQIFSVLQKNGININAIHDDCSSTRISFLCDTEIADKVVNMLHNALV